MCWHSGSAGFSAAHFGVRSVGKVNIFKLLVKEQRRQDAWRNPSDTKDLSRVLQVKRMSAKRPMTAGVYNLKQGNSRKIWPMYSSKTGRRVAGLYTDGARTFKQRPKTVQVVPETPSRVLTFTDDSDTDSKVSTNTSSARSLLAESVNVVAPPLRVPAPPVMEVDVALKRGDGSNQQERNVTEPRGVLNTPVHSPREDSNVVDVPYVVETGIHGERRPESVGDQPKVRVRKILSREERQALRHAKREQAKEIGKSPNVKFKKEIRSRENLKFVSS